MHAEPSNQKPTHAENTKPPELDDSSTLLPQPADAVTPKAAINS